MRTRPETSDLVPGIAAAFFLLALVFGFGMSLWLSIALAVAVYFGVRLAFTKETAKGTERDTLGEIERLSDQIQDGVVRRKVADLCSTAAEVLGYFRENPQNSGGEVVFRDSLRSTLAILRQYVQVTRYRVQTDAVSASVAKFEELLDRILAEFRALHRQLIDQDAAGFEANVEVLKETLRPGLEGAYLPPLKGEGQ